MAVRSASKLRLAPLWPALAALVVVAVLAAALAPRVVATEATRDLAQALSVLAPGLPQPGLGEPVPDPILQGALVSLAAGTDLRLTLIAADGRVLADSTRSLAEVADMENHRTRPEVAAALASGEGESVRHSATVGIDFAYAARRLRAPDSRVWVVRLSRPLRSLRPFGLHLALILLLSAAVAALVALVASFWLDRTLLHPLTNLIESTRKMGDGDYSVRVEVPDESELAMLGRALERIARHAHDQIAAVQAERDDLDATVGSMSEGVLVTDRMGRGRLVNPAFRTLFGVGAGVPARDILDFLREPRLGDLIGRVLADAQPRGEILQRAEPAARTISLLASALAGGDGCVVVARDVTESERLHQMRKDFVANVSHELRTPLAAIRGYAETLADGAAEDAATALRFSGRILEQCRRLGDLLEDLLTLSRLEGTEPLRARGPVELRGLAQEAVEMVAAHAVAKSIAVEIEPGPPVTVEGDAEELLRLLANLLDNAIKYNRPGGDVRLRTAEAGGEARIEVTDSGIGIAASHLPRIFERFYRVDKGRAREEGGTGLGLAIVKHVAQAHQGRIEVESEPGRGSTFRVLLPLRPAS